MENTVAFSYLIDLIEVMGSLFTTQFIFGFSILNLTVIAFLFNAVIGLLLGHIEPRAKSPSDVAYAKSNTHTPMSKGVRQIPSSWSDPKAKESYIGYGRY